MNSVLGIELPDKWRSAPLKHVTSNVNRGTAPDYVDDGPVRMISQAANQAAGLDWSRCRFHSFDGDPRNLKGFLRSGDVLVNSTGTGTLGRVGYFDGSPDDRPCVADGHVTQVRANDDFDPRYLFYWLRSVPFSDYVYAALVVGATNQIELNREKLRETAVPVPPLEEQRRIADFLDAETSRIDALNNLSSRMIAALDERRRAIIDHSVQSPYAGEHKLFFCLSMLRDGTHQPPPRASAGIRFLTARNVSSGVLRTTEYDSFISDSDADGLDHSFKVLPGDLLLTVKGTIGACAVVPENFGRIVLDRNVALLRVSEGTSNIWLMHVIRSQYLQEQMRLAIAAAAQPGLPLGAIRQLRVPNIEESEQRRIADALTAKCGEIAKMVGSIERRKHLLSERRQALITAAVTGQFDVSTASGRNNTQGV